MEKKFDCKDILNGCFLMFATSSSLKDDNTSYSEQEVSEMLKDFNYFNVEGVNAAGDKIDYVLIMTRNWVFKTEVSPTKLKELYETVALFEQPWYFEKTYNNLYLVRTSDDTVIADKEQYDYHFWEEANVLNREKGFFKFDQTNFEFILRLKM